MLWLLLDLLSELVKINDVLFIVKSDGATSEIRSNSLRIRQKEKWITLGDNDGPAHMHVNSDFVKCVEFIKEKKPERISFSVQFFDENHKRILAAFFTKMYDESKIMISERKDMYDQLQQKYHPFEI